MSEEGTQQSQSQLQLTSISNILYTQDQKTLLQNAHQILTGGFTLELSHSTNHAHHTIKYNNQQLYEDTTMPGYYIGLGIQNDLVCLCYGEPRID